VAGKRFSRPRAAAIYVRISSDPSGRQLGVRRQEKDCQALAERKGWSLARIFADDDVSAYVPGRRPAYAELLEAIERAEVDAVVVWDLDRLHRHPAELERFFAVCDEAGVTNLASVAGDVDLASNDGRLMARIMGAVGKKESDDKSRRLRRKHLELAERGLAHGGLRPYGYAYHRNGDGTELVVVPKEAEVVREAAARVLAGQSLRAVTIDLNRRGVRGTKGQPFGTQALRRVLLAPRIAGLREHQGEVLGDAVWEPILERGTWERLRALLEDPARRQSRPARRYLLAGFVRCGVCGGRMKSHPSRRRGYAYACSTVPGKVGCGRISIAGAALDDLVAEALFAALDSPDLADALQSEADDAQTSDVVAELTAAEAKLEELAAAWATDEITRAEWLAARRALEARAATARASLAKATGSHALEPWAARPGALRRAWSELDLDKRRALLGAVLERVVVDPVRQPGRGFDAERVSLQWRV
jgi:DNA invertase Pin-like site-specific DNA recombinase